MMPWMCGVVAVTPLIDAAPAGMAAVQALLPGEKTRIHAKYLPLVVGVK
jgi:hypothetical protein